MSDMVPSLPFPMHPKMQEDQALAFSAKEDEEERRHIQKVQNAFQYYRWVDICLQTVIKCRPDRQTDGKHFSGHAEKTAHPSPPTHTHTHIQICAMRQMYVCMYSDC